MFVCLFVCLFVPKDLANRLTDMVLLYRVASHRSQAVYNYFWVGTTTLPREITKKSKFCFTFKDLYATLQGIVETWKQHRLGIVLLKKNI